MVTSYKLTASYVDFISGRQVLTQKMACWGVGGGSVGVHHALWGSLAPSVWARTPYQPAFPSAQDRITPTQACEARVLVATCSLLWHRACLHLVYLHNFNTDEWGAPPPASRDWGRQPLRDVLRHWQVGPPDAGTNDPECISVVFLTSPTCV